MRPQDLEISQFTYDLPVEKIAKYPLAERDQSKLLVYKDGKIADEKYGQLPAQLSSDSMLVFNATKVLPARLYFTTEEGHRIELFCLEPASAIQDPNSALQQKGSVLWHCLVGGKKKWKTNSLRNTFANIELAASIVSTTSAGFIIEFSWRPIDCSFLEVLEIIGEIPIPPYLKRASEELDAIRYQTLFAKEEGSVAAPTAGLHFTEKLLESLALKNIATTNVTLHVGAGTFKPVKSRFIKDHQMHTEWISVTKETIEKLLFHYSNATINSKLIAVGTTSLRTLESLYWLGVKCSQVENFKLAHAHIDQWEPYELTTNLTAQESIELLHAKMIEQDLSQIQATTSILITPIYTLKIVNALITNFHQPNSTLLLLIGAIVGDDWRKIYDHALNSDYRFLSYGDGSLLFPKPTTAVT
jgi:S-adenosylmethionine:tRNA ribosyltransferase-isomerase